MLNITQKVIDELLQKSDNLLVNRTPIEKLLVHKEQEEQVLISVPIELDKATMSLEQGEYSFNRIFYSQAIPNLNCPVVFDHPQDHYPFMLLREIARQLAIGVSHIHYATPIEKSCNTLSKMSFDIEAFIELDIPLTIFYIDKIAISKPTIQRRELKFFYIQNGCLCAISSSDISVMDKRFYKRFRLNSRNKIVKTPTKNCEDIPSNVDISLTALTLNSPSTGSVLMNS